MEDFKRTIGIDGCGEDLDCEAYVMACDYINHRVQKEGQAWADCPMLPSPTRSRLLMRNLCEEFEASHKKELHELSKQLAITPRTCYPTFMEISKTMFCYEKINWEKIVALYSFGGILSIQCIDGSMPELISTVADWIGAFVEAHLDPWIQTQGGWETVRNCTVEKL